MPRLSRVWLVEITAKFRDVSVVIEQGDDAAAKAR